MKSNFYALALMASMGLSATATELSPLTFDGSKVCTPVAIENAAFQRYAGETGNMMKAPVAVDDIVGDYVVTYRNLIAQSEKETVFTGSAYIEEGDDANTFMVTCPFNIQGNDLEVQFPIVVEGNKVTINSGQTISIMGETIDFSLYEFTATTGDIAPLDKIETYFTGTGFQFAHSAAFGPGNTTDGFFFLAQFASFQKTETPDDQLYAGWKRVGDATFQDGWVMSGLADQTDPQNWYKVELQQSENDPNVYRLVNPYGLNTPLADYNEYADRNGFIQFNIADPDHVYFDLTPANYCNSEMGIFQVYPMNTLSMLMGYYGWPLEEAIKKYGNDLIWSTFKDKVLTVPSEVNPKGGYTNDALFGLDENPYGGYSWKMQDGTSANMEVKIFFPNEGAVEGIEIDNSNAPVKYYNLQGVEISNPEKGELVIKRQGSSVEKMIVK